MSYQLSDTATAPQDNEWEQLILEQLISNDVEIRKDAWAQLYDIHHKKLSKTISGYLWKINFSPDQVEDICGEAWIKALENIHTFHSSTFNQFFKWLKVIAMNIMWGLNRDAKKYGLSTDELIDLNRENELPMVIGRSPEDESERLMYIETFQNTLDTLGYKGADKEIAIRYFLLGEKPRDIASDYGINPKSFNQMIYRIKKNMRGFFGPSDLPTAT